MDHGSRTEVPPSEWVRELDGVLHAEGVSLPALAPLFTRTTTTFDAKFATKPTKPSKPSTQSSTKE